MKIAFTKKRILFSILLVVSVLLFTVLTLLYLQNKGVVNILPISLDKYELVSKYCESEIVNNQKIFKCKAILNEYDVNANKEECFNLSMVTLDYELEDFSICEPDGYVDWDSKTILGEGKTPLHISFNYKTDSINKYTLEEISMVRMEDEQTIGLFSELSKNNYQVGGIITYSAENGYSFSNTGDDIGIFAIDEATIKEISTNDTNISIKFTGKIKDKEVDLQALTPYLLYLPTLPEESTEQDLSGEFITTSTYAQLPLLENASLIFIYIPSTSKITNDKLKEICSGEGVTNPLCFYKSTIDIEPLRVVDVEKKFLDIVKGDGLMDGFILLQVKNNE